jgi:hypothetical protein
VHNRGAGSDARPVECSASAPLLSVSPDLPSSLKLGLRSTWQVGAWLSWVRIMHTRVWGPSSDSPGSSGTRSVAFASRVDGVKSPLIMVTMSEHLSFSPSHYSTSPDERKHARVPFHVATTTPLEGPSGKNCNCPRLRGTIVFPRLALNTVHICNGIAPLPRNRAHVSLLEKSGHSSENSKLQSNAVSQRFVIMSTCSNCIYPQDSTEFILMGSSLLSLYPCQDSAAG